MTLVDGVPLLTASATDTGLVEAVIGGKLAAGADASEAGNSLSSLTALSGVAGSGCERRDGTDDNTGSTRLRFAIPLPAASLLPAVARTVRGEDGKLAAGLDAAAATRRVAEDEDRGERVSDASSPSSMAGGVCSSAGKGAV